LKHPFGSKLFSKKLVHKVNLDEPVIDVDKFVVHKTTPLSYVIGVGAIVLFLDRLLKADVSVFAKYLQDSFKFSSSHKNTWNECTLVDIVKFNKLTQYKFQFHSKFRSDKLVGKIELCSLCHGLVHKNCLFSLRNNADCFDIIATDNLVDASSQLWELSVGDRLGYRHVKSVIQQEPRLRYDGLDFPVKDLVVVTDDVNMIQTLNLLEEVLCDKQNTVRTVQLLRTEIERLDLTPLDEGVRALQRRFPGRLEVSRIIVDENIDVHFYERVLDALPDHQSGQLLLFLGSSGFSAGSVEYLETLRRDKGYPRDSILTKEQPALLSQ
jgi:hypothetical protein